MSTSTDGGLTWGAATSPKGNAAGLGGHPVMQPNGTVIVPVAHASETTVGAFRSTDGGSSCIGGVQPVRSGICTRSLWDRPVAVVQMALVTRL
jgi:hypothetical protein